MNIDHYAEPICSEGFAVFLYDHRNIEIIDGEPRRQPKALDSIDFESKKWGRAVTTGPETGLEIFVPGRQDMSERTINPGFRSADLFVAPLFAYGLNR
jgi:hypothetical protein